MAARSLSLQDHFLNSVRRAKLPVTIFLVKGVKLQGVDHLVRRFLAPAPPRGRVAARLQACDFDDHARASRRPTSRHHSPAKAARPQLQDVFLAAAAREHERMTFSSSTA